MEDSDVEFQDEWEEVQLPDASTGAADQPNGDITINLTGGAEDPDSADGRKRKGAPIRTYTKQEREAALEVHRVHVLCLLAHALLHDQAASSSELQALLLSLLPSDLLDAASAAATSEDPNAAAWLPGLLRWFHRTFTPTALPHMQQPQQPGSSSSSKPSAAAAAAAGRGWQHEVLQDLNMGAGFVCVQQQLLGCVAGRRGSCQQLATLLVAALRGVGFLTRSVWSLEPLPFKPAAVEALLRGRSINSSSKARAGSDAAAAAAAAVAAAAGISTNGKKRGRTPAGVGRVSAAAGSGAAAAAAAAAGGSSNGKRQRRSSNKPAKQQQQAGPEAAAGADAAAAAAAAAGKQRSMRKGDEEFERQLAMAMASTAAEAESRATAAAQGSTALAGSASGHLHAPSNDSNTAFRPPSGNASSKANPKPSGKAQPSGPGALAELIRKGASPAALKAAAHQAAAATPKGWLWAPNPTGLGSVPRVWSEVYIGSSASGRWLHVDGQLGCWDQAGVVEAATARQQPLTYVVACQAGAPKDVTSRYAAKYTENKKWRDDAWWAATMTALRSTAAHLPRHLAAQMAAQPTPAAAPAAAAVAADQPAAVTQKKQQQQRQQQDDQQPTAKRRKTRQSAQQQAGSSSSKQTSHQHSDQPPSSTPAAAAAAAAPHVAAAAAGGDAALRAAREDAELAAAAARQAAQPPSTIEGFKAHPLYVLQRHIPQKQVLLPGAAKLGLHKGEPYFSRSDLQELHTRQHWRRLGRDVKEAELAQPAKLAKKRAVPAATSGGRGGGRGGGFGGGWGPWQRSNSARSTSADLNAASSAAAAAGGDGDDLDADGELPAAAAAASGDGDASAMQQLYGLWQTEDWEPPPAVDGKVPRNEHGNVEVPPFTKALPKGTCYIALPGAAAACRSLGFDYAPALVGFDVQGGRNLPKILGVVVCEEFEEAVVQLHLQHQADKAAAEQQRQRQEVETAWRRLLGNMWTRLQLQRKYGGDADPAAAAAAAAAAGDVSRSASGKQAAGSAKAIVKGLHAAEEKHAAAAVAAAAVGAAAAAAAGQQAARVAGGRPPRRPPGVAGAVAAAAAAGCGGGDADGGVQGAGCSSAAAGAVGLNGMDAAVEDKAEQQQQQQQQQQHELEGVEVEEF